ncbi:MAG: hypothetical protein KDC90_08495 [Ignavibacteriae bacterium]|nr:hypothetical protein [Ignavibacteriota bacterium]
MGKTEFSKKKIIYRKTKNIKNPYAFLGHVKKYMSPWAQHDKDHRVLEHLMQNHNNEIPFNEQQIDRQTIDNDIALKILLNELCDRQ